MQSWPLHRDGGEQPPQRQGLVAVYPAADRNWPESGPERSGIWVDLPGLVDVGSVSSLLQVPCLPWVS